MDLLVLVFSIEVITGLAGLFYIKKFNTPILKMFLVVLWITIAVETYFNYQYFLEKRSQNNFVYNILTSIHFLYNFSLYWVTIRSIFYKRLVILFMSVFLILVIVNGTWFGMFNRDALFHSKTFAFGAILLIVSIAFYLIEMLNSEKIINFSRSLIFWISIALIVYYVGIIPYILYLNNLLKFISGEAISIVVFMINLTMYGCLIFGFIVSDKETYGK